ncbi:MULTISPECIES: alkyl hydroperoxide reductase subunit F [Brachymonas]|uniref:alkyl hydroperoxide reductase subunit F n=1 Tax=Brachymonas TaxID=28219 RepID=UPI002E79187B|nr:alkyl hydroperoxide reductase subunit F [Brachymonas sp. J145]MEE1652468.1 alkyl hydroperoxide reductase subunit F [Brachymonas sp. J145]
MLDQQLAAQLKAYLERVTQPFELVASLDEGKSSAELRGLLEQIAGMSDKITLRTDGDDARKPSFTLQRQGTSTQLRFAAIPLGHEFTSLVLALLWTGGHPPKESEETLQAIRNLPGEYNFEVYMSLSCHSCPDTVQALSLMAIQNPNIKVTIIDGALYQKEVEERQIMGVPTVHLNGEMFANGRMSVEELLAKLDTGAAARDAEKLSQKAPFDVLVVGAGPAGAAAAIYAARKGIRTGLLAERFGGQMMDTLSIENFISVKETEGPRLSAALEEHVRHYDVDVMPLQRAAAIKPAEQAGGLIEVTLENGAVLKSRSVILATGARWREMNIPGETEHKTKGVAFCPHCDGPLFKGKKVAVVGGGNSGVEAAIDLAGIVEHVTLLEFMPEMKADAVLQDKLRSLKNVDILTNVQTTEVIGDGTKVAGLRYKDRASGEEHQLDPAGIFVQIGLLPNTDFVKGTVELSKFGEIVVDARGATNIPGVFAAGDCTTVPYKQIIISMGEGAKASLSAFDYLIRNSSQD